MDIENVKRSTAGSDPDIIAKPVDPRNAPRRRYALPIIDAHVHLTDTPAADLLVDMARRYGISRVLSVSSLPEALCLRKRHGEFLSFAVWPDFTSVGDTAAFRRANSRLMSEGAKHGAVAAKFWFKPEFNYEQGLYLDDKRLLPLFKEIGELGLAVLVHIADPDIWFKRHYHNEKKYLSKRDNYRQLENALAAQPQVNFVAAHFGGDPEDLPHLAGLLLRHKNLYLDTSATKWVARELSAKQPQAREFIIKHAERIIFGTDLVTYHGGDEDYFASRYYVQQRLWEGREKFTSPIEDADAGRAVKVHGMDLPRGVLKKLYHDNAVKVYRLPSLRSKGNARA